MTTNLFKYFFFTLLCVVILSCKPEIDNVKVDLSKMTSLGSKFKGEYSNNIQGFKSRIQKDSTDLDAYLGWVESNVILFIFGYVSRDETLPEAKQVLNKALELGISNSETLRMEAILSYLDWDWESAKKLFLQSISKDSNNLSARHWYSLWLASMGKFEESMAQSDTIMKLDPAEDFVIGRGSLLYFQSQFEELKELMKQTISRDPLIPWGYDWLGMAHNGLGEHKDAIDIYQKAFTLSDGTVEVGGGLGHALAEAGQLKIAKEMADYYFEAAKTNYLPPVQRSFIHIGLNENDEALKLLEQAYKERSWFLIFIQIEPWYNPLRNSPRFTKLIEQMDFPQS